MKSYNILFSCLKLWRWDTWS